MNPEHIPGYVIPAVLKPGTTVVAVLDSQQTRLVVLRVEPMLVCRTPEGHEVTVFAHEVVPADDEPIPPEAGVNRVASIQLTTTSMPSGFVLTTRTIGTFDEDAHEQLLARADLEYLRRLIDEVLA